MFPDEDSLTIFQKPHFPGFLLFIKFCSHTFIFGDSLGSNVPGCTCTLLGTEPLQAQLSLWCHTLSPLHCVYYTSATIGPLGSTNKSIFFPFPFLQKGTLNHGVVPCSWVIPMPPLSFIALSRAARMASMHAGDTKLELKTCACHTCASSHWTIFWVTMFLDSNPENILGILMI